MISIEEARQWVLDKCFDLNEELVSIDQSVGRVLAHDIEANMNHPSFRNSAMDGYAMRREDLEIGIRNFKVIGEIQAGRSDDKKLGEGEAYRIFTGAVVPGDSDIVVMQEQTDRGEEEVCVNSYSGDEKSNIREEGEQIKTGQSVLQKGHVINPASVGLLVSFGMQEVVVVGKPSIGILTTGNELKQPGEKLEKGEIYESNSFSLKAALKMASFENISYGRVEDNLEKSIYDIGEMLERNNVLIISGGISVGKYDFVKRALEANGVEEVFHKINQKPGKPMFFGVKDEKLVFALPGNPASLLVCFYEYVLPALNKLMGKKVKQKVLYKSIQHDIDFKGGRPEFLRGRMEEHEVSVMKGQSSFMLKSFAEANCLIYLHGEKRLLKKGSEVEVHPIY